MSPALDSVHKHAITAPAFEASRLHRERLVDLLHANVPRKLIVIAAPAGYGKTTLLADFTAHTELPVCWVRLTDADADLMRLAELLAASLQRRFRRLGAQPDLARLSGSTPAALARAFVEVIDSKIIESFVIALDDVHLVNRSKPVLEFLDAFFEVQPEQVTVITAGREVPELSLARLMASGDLAGLGPHDLAFDAEELAALGRKQLGVELDPPQIQRVLGETRGWITGVLLSGMLSGSGGGEVIPASRPMVYEYLALVVLNRQPDELRRFMLDSSVLPVMTTRACNEVLQRTDSDRCLSSLLRSGLFVTATDESPRTYEYHPQFRVFLLEAMAAGDPDRLRTLQMRAAAYLTDTAPEHAVDLYLSAGAVRRAAALAEKHARTMYRVARTETLARWADRLRQAGAKIPRVLLALASAATDQGNLDLAEAWLEQAAAALDARASKALRASLENRRGLVAYRRGQHQQALGCAQKAERLLGRQGEAVERAFTLRVWALATAGAKGDLTEAESRLLQAVELLDRPESQTVLAAALADLSTLQTAMGKAHKAYASSLRAVQILQGQGSPYELATALNNLAVDLHFQGRYTEAMDMFAEAGKQARRAASPHRETVILLGQADLFNDLDLALQAAELYGQGLALATQLNNEGLLAYGCAQTCVLHRRRGGAGLAHEWLRRAMALKSDGLTPVAVEIQTAALEVAAAPHAAVARLRRLLKARHAALEAGERAAALYFLARAAFGQEEYSLASRSMDEALTWTGAHGTEQVLAAEMAFDQPFREFSRKIQGTNPVLSMILQRIETMRAIAEQHEQAPSMTETTSHVELAGLGRTLVKLGGRTLSEIKKLPREVLFYLVDHQAVERDVLMETFWPHYNPGRQISNMHTAIYTLRRALGKDAILQSGTQYSLNPDLPVVCDVHEYERAANVALSLPPGDPRRLFALTAAINSYHGQFLPEFASEWVVERRRRLEMRYLDLLATHAEEALVRDQPVRAVTTLRQALEIDPLRDDTNMRLLEALGRLGRRSEVVAHYQRYVRLLADELGLDPPEELRQLYARLIG
jgi:two-component SAPR family response regulator